MDPRAGDTPVQVDQHRHTLPPAIHSTRRNSSRGFRKDSHRRSNRGRRGPHNRRARHLQRSRSEEPDCEPWLSLFPSCPARAPGPNGSDLAIASNAAWSQCGSRFRQPPIGNGPERKGDAPGRPRQGFRSSRFDTNASDGAAGTLWQAWPPLEPLGVSCSERVPSDHASSSGSAAVPNGRASSAAIGRLGRRH
jgi:hypothetical protein